MGGQLLGVELQGAVADPIGLGGQGLEGAEMGGGNGAGAEAGQGKQCRGGQRRPLRRVGAAADFVDQDQGPLIGFLEHGAQGGKVGAEGRQVCSDGLMVADVGIDAMKDRQRTSRPHRRHDSALHQRSGKADGLEQHSFPAGVGAADDQGALPLPQA